MNRRILLLLTIIALAGCSNIDSQNPFPGSKLVSMEEIKKRLNKHDLSKEDKPYYQLIGAFDGLKATVNDDYRLEIYIFKNPEALTMSEERMGTVDSLIWKTGDILFVLHTTDPADLEALKADISR